LIEEAWKTSTVPVYSIVSVRRRNCGGQVQTEQTDRPLESIRIAAASGCLLLLDAHFLPAFWIDLSSCFLFLLHLLSSPPPTHTVPRKTTTTSTTSSLLQASIGLKSHFTAHPTDTMSASPTPSGGADAKPADQIHFRFCREW
jgi:hypothetical protein